MFNLQKLCVVSVVAACGSFAAATWAAAPSSAGYPSKPVKIVIPLGPGNSLEISTRLLAERIGVTLGQPFLIETQPGAAGQIGTERVARSPADGYTLLVANDGVITMLPNLQKKVPFDSVRDFAPITRMVGIPFALVVHPSVSAHTAEELVGLARAAPKKLEYSSGGVGSAQQLVMELFMRATRTELVHVPYKGAPQAATDLVAGHIPAAFAGVPIVAEPIKQGKLRALGIASAERLPLLADVPTLIEQGIALRFATWGGLFAPAGTPAEIIRSLNRATLGALAAPEIRTKLSELGFEIYSDSPEEFSRIIRADLARIADVVREAGIERQ